MTIAVVQFKSFAGATSGSFTSPVNGGNTIVLWVNGYNTINNVISSSNPQYNGSPVAGARQLYAVQCGPGNVMYTAVWLLPNVAGGGTLVSFTLTNSNTDINMGFAIAEVSGLGNAPALDPTTPNPSTASALSPSTTPNSGTTGNIVGAPELIVGGCMNDAAAATGPGAPWTVLIPSSGGGFCFAGYQIATSPGAGYAFTISPGGATDWAAGVAAIQPGSFAPPGIVQRRPLKKLWLLGV